jgi:hypothetical protein
LPLLLTTLVCANLPVERVTSLLSEEEAPGGEGLSLLVLISTQSSNTDEFLSFSETRATPPPPLLPLPDDVFELLTPTPEGLTPPLSFKRPSADPETETDSSAPKSSSVEQPLSLPQPLPSSSLCDHDLCVSRSLRGNSYHTYRTAFLTQTVLAALSLPTRIQAIALEILHTVGVSLIERQALSQTPSLSLERQLLLVRASALACPLWTKDETSAVAVASICMACKVAHTSPAVS